MKRDRSPLSATGSGPGQMLGGICVGRRLTPGGPSWFYPKADDETGVLDRDGRESRSAVCVLMARRS